MSRSPFTGQRFRRALRWFVAGRAAQAAATIGLTLLTVRLLSPDDYGAYMIVWGLVELATPITSLGLLPAVQRFLPEFAAHGTRAGLMRFVRNATLVRLALIGAFCAALLFGWPTFSAWLGMPAGHSGIAAIAAGVVLCVLMNRFTAEMLECLLEQRYAQTARAILPALRFAGLLLLWSAGAVTLPAVLLVDLGAAAFAALLGEVWFLRRLRALDPGGRQDIVARAELVRFFWHMSAAQLLNALASVGTLRIVVARVLGIEAAGQFAFLQQLIMIGSRYLPSTLLANMIRPLLISRHALGQRDDVAVGLGLLWKLNVATAWPIVALAAVVGDPIVRVLSGGRIAGAGLVFLLLLVALVAAAQLQVVTMAMQVYRYSAALRNVSLLALLAPLLVWAGSRWGLPGAAAGVAIAAVARSSAGTWVLQSRPHNARLDLRGVGRLLACLVAATGLAWILQGSTHWTIGLTVFVLAYAGLARVARPLTVSESGLMQRALGGRAAWLHRWTGRG